MTPTTQRIAGLHARLPQFKLKEAKALATITAWSTPLKQPYVAFSTGKDSTVVLDLVRRLAPKAVAIHNDHEWYLPETLEVLRNTPNIRRVARSVWHAEGFTSWREKPDAVPEGIEWSDTADLRGTWAPAQGFDGAAVGIRAGENSYRRIHIRKYGDLFFVKQYRVWHCYPIAWWTTLDVWAYILSRGLLYNRAYDKMDEAGIPLEQQRIGPLAVERVLGRGQIALLKRLWPETYRAFIAAYPEMSTYV